MVTINVIIIIKDVSIVNKDVTDVSIVSNEVIKFRIVTNNFS
jgi:hypothetical protein